MDKTSGKVLMIGEGDAGKSLLSHKGITYINRNSTHAAKETETALRALCKDKPADTLAMLKEAFALRNKVVPAVFSEAVSGTSVARMLTDANLSEPSMPVQISRLEHGDVMAEEKFSSYREVILANRAAAERAKGV